MTTTWTRCALVAIALLALPLQLRAQGVSPDEAHIRKLVEQLGDNDPDTRDKAQAELAKIGAPAVPALREALRSDDLERCSRAKDLLAILAHIPGEADLVALAESLRKAFLATEDDAVARDHARGILAEFAKRFSPKEGSATYTTQDKETLTICLGSAATTKVGGSNAQVKADTRWVIAIGGAGLDVQLGGLPGPNDQVPDSAAGNADAEATQGIAIALAGDGLLLRTAGGIAGGGRGGDAKAQSPVYGLALEGKDRTGSMVPPNDGKSEGSGDLESARKLLVPSTK